VSTEVLEKRSDIERRRRVPSAVDMEIDSSVVERMSPRVPRVAALSKVHFTDHHLRTLLPIKAGDVVRVMHNDSTAAEQALLDDHFAFLRGERATPPDDAALPRLDPALSVDDMLHRIAAVPHGLVTSPVNLTCSLPSKNPIVGCDVDLNTKLETITDDTMGHVFVLYCENVHTAVVNRTLLDRLCVLPSQLRILSCGSASRAVSITIGFAFGVAPGNLMSVNAMRFPVGLVRLSNLMRTDFRTTDRIAQQWMSAPLEDRVESTVMLRRCSKPQPVVEWALETLRTKGYIDFRVLPPHAVRGIRALSLLVQRQSFDAFTCLLRAPDATPDMERFLEKPTRDRAHEYVEKAKASGVNKRTSSDRLISVFGASGSSTAALCALEPTVRKSMGRACTFAAFNAMAARRHRRHGARVVVGDMVVVAAGDDHGGTVLLGEKDTAEIETAEAEDAEDAPPSVFIAASRVRRVESEEEAARYSHFDIVLPLLRWDVTKPEHLPSCAGLRLGEVKQLLEPLGLDWILPGEMPPTAPACVANEFTFPLDRQRPDTALFCRVYRKPNMSFVTVTHPGVASGKAYDAACLLPHDRALLAAGVDPTIPGDNFSHEELLAAGAAAVVHQPLKALLDAREENAAAASTTSFFAALESVSCTKGTSLPLCGIRASYQNTTSAPFVEEHDAPQFTPDDFVTYRPTGDGLENEPEFTTPVSGAESMEAVCVVSAAVQVRGPSDGVLREMFIQHGLTVAGHVALQNQIHRAATEKDVTLDYALSTNYCRTCFSMEHKEQGCPARATIQAQRAARRERTRHAARHKAAQSGATLTLQRSSASEKWGLRLNEEGHLVAITANSPGHAALLASPAGRQALPPAVAREKLLPVGPSTASPARVAHDAVVPLDRVYRVLAVNGVPTRNGAEVVAAIAKLGVRANEVRVLVKELKRTLSVGHHKYSDQRQQHQQERRP
jgi:hypothetical protein